MSVIKSHLLILIASSLLAGCMAGGYSVEREPMGSPRNTSGASTNTQHPPTPIQDDGQRVIFSLSQDYDRDPPACVVIRSADASSARSVLAADVGQAVTIHLQAKFDRVIGPAQLQRLLAKQKLDLDHPGDARAFAWKTRCRAVLTWKLTSASETFLLAFGARNIGLALTLKRFGKDDILWQARHRTSRTGGGLPLSPVGLVVDTVRAGQFMDDRDMLPSMIHDVVRRLFTTLPESY
ncbi:MAG: hypothetical protein HOE62_04415 [Alphaproteobacteria bacterium]|jgi:hypothetical protein|nr:hypothetical protein [Alphaproteobacteria bacterium]MBT4017167.1 hypothetical protein [Alphaproteobacteria bacterium]MBT4966253.1 hypothetical protein [Alphaproteobacteria bacterium]MBT5159184.1 hypothetical protein [Alphaproteobacteria bacterium]MBT5917099.1 hypothetical protein [Alphaproteobacteria bacterium]